MKIKLLQDIPVDPKHDLIEGKILEVLRLSDKDKKEKSGWWVQGNGEEVLILFMEAEIESKY